jgi:chromosome segregation ATPase
MSESTPVVAAPESREDALGLLDRLDPAIGEATSLVGAMLTELLRRTLRGGVVRIGDEMHGFVSGKVDTAIAERTPGLEQRAAEVAEHAARTAATEVAAEEVHALEQRTQAGDLELADKIAGAARAAEQQTRESAVALAARIKESEQRGQAALQAGDLELAGKITEAARAAEQRATESAAALAAQIKDSEQRGQAALHEQVQTLIDRSREGSERLKARFAEQDNLIAGLGKQLESVGKDLRMLQKSHSGLSEALHRLQQEQQNLAARVAELEKPRGLRALWLWLFGRRKAKPAEPVVAA